MAYTGSAVVTGRNMAGFAATTLATGRAGTWQGHLLRYGLPDVENRQGGRAKQRNLAVCGIRQFFQCAAARLGKAFAGGNKIEHQTLSLVFCVVRYKYCSGRHCSD